MLHAQVRSRLASVARQAARYHRSLSVSSCGNLPALRPQALVRPDTKQDPFTLAATPLSLRCSHSFSSQPIQPNPLGSTNTSSGVGTNPVGTSSAPDSEAVLPNPLAASTNVSTTPEPVAASSKNTQTSAPSTSAPASSSGHKPDPLAASTNVSASEPGQASSSNPKPDPLAASTNVSAPAAGPTDSTSSFSQSSYDGPPKLIVFGGNGFVGTRVCEEALNTGLAVVSVSRSGAPKATSHWTSQVDWLNGDAFEPEQWRDQLQGAVGVVSCLGAFGSNDFMLKVCGEANVGVIREAAKAGVPRCAFISVHDYNFPAFVLSGYFQGKRNAEQAVAASFPDTGVCLRPGFMHGTRYVSGSVGIPLGLIGSPLAKGLGFLPTKTLSNFPIAGAAFVPPISVQAAAKAAVAAATDPAVPAGIMDIWQMKEYEN